MVEAVKLRAKTRGTGDPVVALRELPEEVRCESLTWLNQCVALPLVPLNALTNDFYEFPY